MSLAVRRLAPAPAGTPLGCRLRELRQERGLSVAALAARTGVSYRRLYNAEYVNSFTGLEADELEAVAAALRTTVSRLAPGTSDAA